MFTTTDENMLKTDFNWKEKYTDFDPIEDIEPLAMQEKRCIIRT